MKIIIEGDSQDLNLNQLATLLRSFYGDKDIEIDINGLKYKGKVTEISYEQISRNKLILTRSPTLCRITTITVWVKNGRL